jgi:tRNA(His) 5'-end guanylyltransferase
MSKNCPINKRMKENYEIRSRSYLIRRTPVIIRLDGKAFHTYTRGLNRPFDDGLMEDMVSTTKYLCENIDGCKLGYTQSDEISLLLTDYDKLDTGAYFDYEIQKLVSITASMASAKFNQLRLIREYNSDPHYGDGLNSKEINSVKLANFDSRAFNVPKEEVSNYFLARQRDAVKNSISMLAQSLYSHNELHKKNSSEMQEMCFQKDHNWNDLDSSKKRGSTIIKNTYVNDKLIHKLDDGDRSYLFIHQLGDIEFIDGDWNKFFELDKSRKLDNPKIRTYWEKVETPIKFDDNYFKFLI